MSDFSVFKATLAEWANRADWSDDLLTSFVRAAEEKLNQELRIDRMICNAVNNVTQGCAVLPDNWLESDFMLIAANTPTGWWPINYKPRDQFYREPSTTSTYHSYDNSTYGYYTIEGREIIFGGPVDALEGTQFQMSFYSEIPVFSDTVDSWVYTKYPSLYRYCALIHADLHAIGEEQSSANMKALAEDMIQKLNAAHRYARASGSRIARGHIRSFG
jgi:hypothetical protein